MKNELSMLCGNSQSSEKIAHANPKMFVMVIHWCGMVGFGLGIGPLASGKRRPEMLLIVG
jgi:hypothetical protein